MPKCYSVMAQSGVSFFARWRSEEANVGNAFFFLYFFQASLDKRTSEEREKEWRGKRKKKIMQQNFRLKLKLRFLP